MPDVFALPSWGEAITLDRSSLQLTRNNEVHQCYVTTTKRIRKSNGNLGKKSI